MASLLALYPRLAWARVRSQAQYRFSFVLYIAGAFVLTIGDFLVIWVVFEHLPALGGWSFSEVAFLYGASYVSFKTADLIVGHLDLLPELVRTGMFDGILVRPLGSLFQVITGDFAVRHIGGISQGALVLAAAVYGGAIDWDAGRAAMLVVMLVSGCAIFAAIWVIGASTVFWTTGTGLEVLNTFTYGGNQLTSYPVNIYAGWLRRLLAFVVPLAFVNYFPSLYILGREDPLGSWEPLRFASPIVAVALVLAARHVWGLGVRHYHSTGS